VRERGREGKRRGVVSTTESKEEKEERTLIYIYIYVSFISLHSVQSGEDSEDALNCRSLSRSLSAKEPLIIGPK